MNNDAKQFLARVIDGNGNYYVLAVHGPRGMSHHAFKPDTAGFLEGEKLIDWAVRTGLDIYQGNASYTMAFPKKDAPNRMTLSRKRTNVQSIKVLAIDCDVSRPGDGKTNAFATQPDAVAWLFAFCKGSGMLFPNMAVCSGYGLHFYWVLEAGLGLTDWQPLADALRTAAQAHGYTGDTQSTVDAARILRPPTSVNMKSGSPVPVYILPAFTRQDYKHADILAALTPFMGATATGTNGTGATASGLGARPAHVTPGSNPLNAAARAGIEHRKVRFADIAPKCQQISTSLAVGGNGDGRDLWFLGFHSLAVHCEDGQQAMHDISKGDPRYNVANVDSHFALAQKEMVSKGLGAPLCTTFDKHRSGVCQQCPHWGRIVSPVSLAREDGDLPSGYRRNLGRIERIVGRGEDTEWVPVFRGDVFMPALINRDTGGYRLEFNYRLSGRVHRVGYNGDDAGQTKTVIIATLERQGLSIKPDAAKHVMEFIVAWITQLREQKVRAQTPRQVFGWTIDQGDVVGAAVAGVEYMASGTQHTISGGDRVMVAAYTPHGALDQWRKAAKWFEGLGNRPDLQLFIALSFGAPLLSLAGEVMGTSFNIWSPEGGTGKSTAMRLAQAIWGDRKFIQSQYDTPNAVANMTSRAYFMPKFWDEMRIGKSDQDKADFVSMIYQISQGREKARLTQSADQRELREWCTIMLIASNRALSDVMGAHSEHTDAGILRLLDIRMPTVSMGINLPLSQDVALCDHNYGHAGVEFIKHVVTHVNDVRTLMAGVSAVYAKSLVTTANDRFVLAGMTCAMAGAAIAKQIGLFNFDLNGIDKVLRDAFNEAHDSTARIRSVTTTGQLDLPEIVRGFCDRHLENRLYTQDKSSGKKASVLLPLPYNGRIHYQICHNDAIILISVARFKDYLGELSLPHRLINDLLNPFNGYGARIVKQTLGAGTIMPQTQEKLLEVKLAAPFDTLLDTQFDIPQATIQALGPRPRPLTPNQGNQTKETQT